MYPLTELRRLLAPTQSSDEGIVVSASGLQLTVATSTGPKTVTTSTPIAPGTRVKITSAGSAIPSPSLKRYPV